MAVAFAVSFARGGAGGWEGSDGGGTEGPFTPCCFRVTDREDKQSLFDAVFL